MNAVPPHSGLLSWPHSKAGTVGAALALLFLVVLGLNLAVSSGGDQNGFLVFATFLAAIGALVSLVLSAVAIVRQHERSVVVFLPLVIGVLVLAFLAIEIFAGHD